MALPPHDDQSVAGRSVEIRLSRDRLATAGIALAAGLLGIAAWIVIVVALTHPLSPVAIGIYLMTCGLCIVAGDWCFSLGTYSREPRSLRFDRSGVQGDIIPSSLARRVGTRIEFRSPVLRIRRAVVPIGGLQWNQVELIGVKSGSGVFFTFDGQKGSHVGGRLLRDSSKAFVTADEFLYLTDAALHGGGVVRLFRRSLPTGVLRVTSPDMSFSSNRNWMRFTSVESIPELARALGA